MLTNPVYAGRMRWNYSDSRSPQRKVHAEQIFASVPCIIAPETFDHVQALLRARNPPRDAAENCDRTHLAYRQPSAPPAKTV